ncbi:MAG: DNA polymerase III subunit gamma/tau, partial [Oscillospiraceae bacterium]|nr:DNA polymerase III subunit gamma/tau [Oscillospiraceae bacterium]
MYQALYRKYRPRCFSGVIGVAGQEHVTETLRRQIEIDRLSHAYLFVGTRGTGKTTCAKILARAVNCLNPQDGEPCNICTACVGIEDGSILDVLEIDAASNNSVDNVRALRDEAIYSPSTVKKRVYIVDEVHMLSISAFNALLKILEEPPPHILFILATTELHKVPATIQSRCQKFSFKRLSPADLSARLSLISEHEGLKLTKDAANKLASLADGSMRDGISLLDQCASDKVIDIEHVQDTLGFASVQQLSYLIDAITKRDTISSLNVLDELYRDGKDMTSLLNEISALFRDLLVFKLSPNSGLLLNVGFDSSTLSTLSEKLNSERLFFCLDVVKSALSGLSRGGSSRLSVEMCLMKMCDERLMDNSEALLSRISRLESQENVLAPAVGHPPTSNNIVTESVSVESETFEVDTVELDAVEVMSTPEVAAPEAIAPKAEHADVSTTTSNQSVEAPSPSIPSSDEFWATALELIKNEPFLYALLNDSSKVQVEQQDDIVVIKVTDEFTAIQIKSEFMDLLKDIAKKVLNRDVGVRIELVDSIATNEDKLGKLEHLSNFDIIKFE